MKTRITLSTMFFAIGPLLATSTPAAAFNDPVAGRWLTRDPLHYNAFALDPSETAARMLQSRLIDALKSRTSSGHNPRIERYFGTSYDHGQPQKLFEYESGRPTFYVDPYGLIDCYADNFFQFYYAGSAEEARSNCLAAYVGMPNLFDCSGQNCVADCVEGPQLRCFAAITCHACYGTGCMGPCLECKRTGFITCGCVTKRGNSS